MLFVVLMLVGLTGFVVSVRLSTRLDHSAWGGRRSSWRRWRPSSPLGGGGRRNGLSGEALFATGLDRCTVLLDCLVNPRGAIPSSPLTRPRQPVPVRVRRPLSASAEQSLPATVKEWADGGQRVFVDVPPGEAASAKAELRCGGAAMTVDIDNSAEIRRALERCAQSPLSGPG